MAILCVLPIIRSMVKLRGEYSAEWKRSELQGIRR
jgi:hypothetical protein